MADVSSLPVLETVDRGLHLEEFHYKPCVTNA